jgi:prepilin-type N-terminal cleavage/methylation domain-containing protein
MIFRLAKKNTARSRTGRGFTLAEIIVAVAVFTVVVTISTGSILSIFDANRKAQNLRSVMDNLNLTLENMTRTIRFGGTYHCDVTQGNLSVTRDCSGGASSMSVFSSAGTTVLYRLSNSRIERSVDGGASWSQVTSADVTVTKLSFYVLGSPNYSSGDRLQPRVVLVVGGYAGSKATSRTTFTLQTTVSQRNIDSQ